MTRIISQPIETKLQLLDVNGDPVTAATVSYTIYGENDVSHFTGSMVHIGSGIYSCSWTPDAVGEWTAECYSSNPKFRKSFTYYVEESSVSSGVSFSNSTFELPTNGTPTIIYTASNETAPSNGLKRKITIEFDFAMLNGDPVQLYIYKVGPTGYSRQYSSFIFPEAVGGDPNLLTVDLGFVEWTANDTTAYVSAALVENRLNQGETATIAFKVITELL